EHAGESVLVSFPVSIPADTDPSELFPFLSQQGYLRVLIGGRLVRTDEPGEAECPETTITVIQDRVTLTEADRPRLLEALEQAFSLGKGNAAIHLASDPAKARRFSSSWMNPATGNSLRPPSPALFSFNNPLGACPKCRGFGRVIGLDLDKSVPDPSLSIRQGVIKPFQGERGEECQRDLLRCCKERRVDIDTPWEDLDEEIREWVYYGDRSALGPEDLEE